jgi:hypothetical protein
MGSFALAWPVEQPVRPAANVLFQDSDGVGVLATLFIDRGGVPAELRFWKANCSAVVGVPEVLPMPDVTWWGGWREAQG